MGVPRLFATALWLAVTAAATAMVWAATSTVAAEVTDRPAPVIAHREVVNELASGTTPTTAPSLPGPPSTTTAPPVATTTTALRAATPPPAVTAPSTAPPTTPKATPAPTTTTTAAPSQPTATYATTGGVVRVACNGVFITLLSAIPANGFAANVVARGPANVEVHFVRPGQDLSVKAVCFGSPIRYYDDFPSRFASMAF